MNKRKLLFLLVAVSVLGGAGVLWTNNVLYPKSEVTLNDLPPKCSPHDIRVFSLSRPDGKRGETTIKFERTDPVLSGVSDTVKDLRARWSIDAPIHAEADAKLIQRMVASICHIPRAFALEPKDPRIPADFPLRMDFSWNRDGVTEPWQFAFTTQPKDRRVVMRLRKGEEELFFSVPDFYMQLVGAQLLSYQNRRVMSSPLDSVEVFTFKDKGKPKFTLERNGSSWLLIEDGKKAKLANESARKFVNRMATLKAVNILEPNRDDEKCNIDGSDYAIEIKGRNIPDEAIAFRLEKSGKRENYSACSSNRLAIFSVHKDIKEYLKVDSKEFF